VTAYLDRAKLLEPLEQLGFHVVGYGCTTCIGNSGPLPEAVARAVQERQLVVAAVLSGNRNFEARIHSMVRANYLASPLLVVAYALAGRIDIDFEREPLGTDAAGAPVFLRELWPSPAEIGETLASALGGELFAEQYATVFDGDERWRALPVAQAGGGRFGWDPASTYIAQPPYFDAMRPQPLPVAEIRGARALLWLGDSVTTDHISPAGSIPLDGPAGQWLRGRGVEPADFNTLGSRRGHHEVMVRGTFGNVRIRNRLVPDREGNWSVHLPSGTVASVYEVAMRYQSESTPLVVLAGKEYGTGSSRDWAAKGTALLGVRAVLAESFERIHRGNLVGMGVLPLELPAGQTIESLGLDGREQYDIAGVADAELRPHAEARIVACGNGGRRIELRARVRLDTAVDVDYYRHGGILPYVLRRLAVR
jgi:aconitate hydratase